MSNYRDQLESYLKTLDIKADRVLDVGGAAKPVKDRVKDWQVKEYHILDNGLEERDQSHIIDYTFDINFEWPDRSNDVNPYRENYDYVFCLEVFEYVFNPIQAIKNLYSVLKPKGILYITFPFIYPIHEPKDYDYLRYTKTGVIKLLEMAGFKILEIPRVMNLKGFEYWKEFIKAEGMHAAKGINHNELGWIIKCVKV